MTPAQPLLSVGGTRSSLSLSRHGGVAQKRSCALLAASVRRIESDPSDLRANIVSMWSYEQLVELAALVESNMTVGQIARRLNRPYSTVAAQIARGGLNTRTVRAPKLPRGKGYDKASTKQHLVSLWRTSQSAQQYARAQKLSLDLLVLACRTHFPAGWADYARTHPIPVKTCGYCQRVFHPNSARQEFCSAKCSGYSRADANYFDGRRRQTIGMESGICQCCERPTDKGMTPHHMFGKENDEEAMVGLCRGCHQLVTILAQRVFVDDPHKLENLIALAWTRKHGADPSAEEFHADVTFNVTEPKLIAV